MSDAFTHTPTNTLTLGVIGHVDHGKTTLVKALTGVETDRLAEERERGLSIVLGFATYDSADLTIDLIDVPGHQAFIRTMVAGATGLDGAILVVAANEGIMPQTREHFAIASLLNLSCGVIALTKSDIASETELSLRELELREFIAGSFLEGASIIRVAAANNEGIDALGAALRALPPHKHCNTSTSFYLPIDRIFTRQGFGVVVTGTLRGGPLTSGTELEVLPQRSRAGVRALQVHGHSVDSVKSGQRVAINLKGIEQDMLQRGNVIASKDYLKPTRRFDVRLQALASNSSALRNAMTVHLLIGTTEAQAKLRLLGVDEIAPGEQAFVQIRCDREIVCCRDDHFIIRANSPSATLGGGIVIDPIADRRKRFDTAAVTRLTELAELGPAAGVQHALEDAPTTGIEIDKLAYRIGAPIEQVIEWVHTGNHVLIDNRYALLQNHANALLDNICAALGAFHSSEPQIQGHSAARIATALKIPAGHRVFDWAIEQLRTCQRISGSNNQLHLSDHDSFAGLSESQRRLAEKINSQILDAGIQAIDLASLAAQGKGVRDALSLLLERGQLVKLQTNNRKRPLIIHADALAQARTAIATHLPKQQRFAIKDVRDLLKSTRKHIVPLMEHFDATGFTLRQGDMRQVRTE